MSQNQPTMVLLEGPEKAGKTTLAKALMQKFTDNMHTAILRHWGPVSTWLEYFEGFRQPLLDGRFSDIDFIIWDRGWPSESVYANLLRRDRALSRDPFLAEWCIGRGFQYQLFCLGPDARTLMERRTADDLPVDPAEERATYDEYRQMFSHQYITSARTGEMAPYLAIVLMELRAKQVSTPHRLPQYCGPTDARVVYVGEARNEDNPVPGGWLPFSSHYTTQFGRTIGPAGLSMGWTNAADDPTYILDHAKLVVTMGDKAKEWLRANCTAVDTVHLKHPNYVYRWKRYQAELQYPKAAIQEIIDFNEEID